MVASGRERFAKGDVLAVGKRAPRFIDANRDCIEECMSVFDRGKMRQKPLRIDAFAIDTRPVALRDVAAWGRIAQYQSRVVVCHTLVVFGIFDVDIEA